MSRRAAILAFGLLCALIVAAGARYRDVRAPAMPPLPSGGDFALATADGPVSLAGLHGKVVLIYFGYASCPDVCPSALGLAATALRSLAPGELARVRVVFVSVDPQRDTPDSLKQYAGHFHPNVIGATAPRAVLDELIARYGGGYRHQPVESAAGYVVDHTSITSVVATDGRLVEQLPHGTPPAVIVRAIRHALGR